MQVLIQDNNKSSIKLVKNTKFYTYIKYINIQYYYIRKLVSEKEFIIEYIIIKNIFNNKFIKILLKEIFKSYYIKLKLIKK